MLVAPYTQVYVGDEPGAQALARRAEAPVGERARDLLFEDGADGLAVDAEHVDAAVQVVAAVGRVVSAAHLAHRGRDLVPLQLRVERPREGAREILQGDSREHFASGRLRAVGLRRLTRRPPHFLLTCRLRGAARTAVALFDGAHA